MTPDELLDLATERHRAADLPAARTLYREVLAQAPGHAAARFRAGLLELQEGKPAAALPMIERAVAISPDRGHFQFGLGDVLAALGRWTEAEAAYGRALRADPQSADAHFAQGVALEALRKYEPAIAAYEAAVQYRPEYPEALNNLGNCYQARGNFREAEAAYHKVLTLQPNDANATSNLGVALQASGWLDDAITLLRRAVALEPSRASHAVNYGAALCQRQRFVEATIVLSGAVELDPRDADAAYNLANALQGLGRLRDATDSYRRAIALRPDHADAFNNLGNAYKSLGDFQLALAAYESAARARPGFVVAMNNAGCLLRTLGRLDEAETVLRRAIHLNPDHPALHDNLASVLKDAGDLEGAIDCFRRAVELDPDDAGAHSNFAYALSFRETAAAPILAECRQWNDRHAAPLRSPLTYAVDRNPHRRLRIGYVSPDFRDHCQSLFTIPLLSHHDHAAVEVFCYASVERPDGHTRRIASLVDVWRDVRAADDAALADVIRADRIDVLVDLTMHMADGRPLLFAREPAPVQIAWLAYPGTTGLDAIDYRLTDPRLDPPGTDDHYAERTIRLPDSFWCYDPLTSGPPVNPLPALSRGFVTFGCLNNPCKLTDLTLQLWAGVMRELPDARLLLLAPPGRHRHRLRDRLSAHGISPDRVDFVAHRPRGEYLRTYHRIDVGLDTFPYNGHTTTLDSLWMGVPVVSRVGQTCVGRGGLSQSHQLDLLELATETDAAFVNAAVALARDLPRLAGLREGLRGRLERSPLMDAPRFARNVEAAYRAAFEAYCARS